jgi:hypothetical protein
MPEPLLSMSYLHELPLSVEATGFTLQDLVDVHVGILTIKMYPKITPTMPVFERAHAFQVNKSALNHLQTNLRFVFDAFGDQLNATYTINGILSDWKRHFHASWYDFVNLHMLSFHDSKRNIIPSTTLPNDSQVLKAVQDGNVTDCRSKDIRFVRVRIELDFLPK